MQIERRSLARLHRLFEGAAGENLTTNYNGFWLISRPWKFSPCDSTGETTKASRAGKGRMRSHEMREATLITATFWRPAIPDVTFSLGPRLCPDCTPTFSLSLFLSLHFLASHLYGLFLSLSLTISLSRARIFLPLALSSCSDAGNFKHVGTTFVVIKEDRFCLMLDSSHRVWLIIRDMAQGERIRSCEVSSSGSPYRNSYWTSDNCRSDTRPQKNKIDRRRKLQIRSTNFLTIREARFG